MSKKEKIIIIIITFAIIALLVVVGALIWRGFPGREEAVLLVEEKKITPEEEKEAAQKTQELIDEIKEIAKNIGEDQGETISKVVAIEDNSGAGNEKKQAVIAAPGTSPISVEDGEVVTVYGNEAKNEATPGSVDAPRQSSPLNPSELPASAIKLSITPNSITPAEFRVKAGQAVLLAATAGEDSMETFSFADSKLRAVTLGLFAGETRAITFKAPVEKGEYAFFSNITNHRENGAEGKMIVE